MKRAAILIGVQKASLLPELEAVWDGVELMRKWAKSQKFKSVSVITDKERPVENRDIFNAVKKAIKPENRIDQLIVYFSGHGINKNYCEYWLLSDAPDDPNAAVNVLGSTRRALFCGVKHVVFISDACRTAPEGIKASGITGSIIFPSVDGAASNEVDVFYATTLGEPALEIKDKTKSAEQFVGVFTDVLAEALNGSHKEVIASAPRLKQVVRPILLKQFLKQELPIRVFNMTKKNPRSQVPDAEIQSHDKWISIIPEGPVPISGTKRSGASVALSNELVNAQRRFVKATSESLANPQIAPDKMLTDVRSYPLETTSAGAEEQVSFIRQKDERFARNFELAYEPFGPEEIDTHCGFKIRGAKVEACSGVGAQYEQRDHEALVSVKLPENQAATSLLAFNDGTSALLPAIHGFICALTFDNDNLVHVSYEPSRDEGFWRWQAFNERKDEIRKLRAIAASSSRLGIFKLESDDAESLARKMQNSKAYDPSLAIYAAHAYQDQQRFRRLEGMYHYMLNGLGFCMFDVALLAGKLDRGQVGAFERIQPQLPLLAQAWPLLPALEIQMPEELKNIAGHVMPNSLWTLYDKEGTEMIANSIEKGVLR